MVNTEAASKNVIEQLAADPLLGGYGLGMPSEEVIEACCNAFAMYVYTMNHQ